MPVAGQIDYAGGLRRNRVGTSNWRQANRDLTRNRAQSRNSTQELALAVALYARESNDLAGTDLKIDSLQDGVGQVAHHYGRNGALVHFALHWESAFNRAPDNEGENLALGNVGGRERPAKPAVTKDRNTIGDTSNLRKPMRDVDDRGTPRLDGFDSGEKVLGFSRRQRFGRLIEHEHARALRDRLRDFDELPLSHAQIANPCAFVETGANCRQLLPDPGALAYPLCASCPRHAVKKVLGDGEVSENGGVLINDAEPQLLRSARRRLFELLAVDFNRARVGGQSASGDRH